MNEWERRALTEVRFDLAPNREQVWQPPGVHVEGLNGYVAQAILDAFDEAAASPGPSPLGVVVEGQHGAGKTHLLRWTRTQVLRRDGYFFLIGLTHGRNFWSTIVQTYLTGLRKPGADDRSQLTLLLDRLADGAGVGADLRDRVTGRPPLTGEALRAFVAAVRRANPNLGRQSRHVLRALVLLGAVDVDLQDIGEAILASQPDGQAEDWVRWEVPVVPRTPQEIAEEISRLLAITGPSLLAADQIDTIFAQAQHTAVQHTDGTAGPDHRVRMADELGTGLMDLREVLHRTVTVVACLPSSWQLISDHALASIVDRFRRETRLTRLASPEVGRELIAASLAPAYRAAGFEPPWPTWPVRPAAFDEAPDYTPRKLLQRVEAHIQSCLRRDRVVPLDSFAEVVDPTTVAEPPARPDELAELDTQFAQLRRSADVDAALEPATEDQRMPELLSAGLHAWVEEQGAPAGRYVVTPGLGTNPTVHAMLREILDETIEDEAHWSFRAISRPHHRAVQARIERVRMIADLDPEITSRRAILLRAVDIPWPAGPVTQRKLREFRRLGGTIVAAITDDLQVFSALAAMFDEKHPAFPAWLRSRRPAGGTVLFRTVFGPPLPDPVRPVADPPDGPTRGPASERAGPAQEPAGPVGQPGEPAASIRLGTVLGPGMPFHLTLESLRKHVAIFAGSGSGKTVLIRRLIEECALAGVSTIALDPNNDLARLGDRWPQAPASWDEGDSGRADDYLAGTDVVIWTPRRESGRPLSLQPLPDFGAVLDDPDDFELALDTAVAALAPRARMAGNTAKMERGRAVLRETLSFYARRGGNRLTGFVDLLAELPDEVTPLSKAAELAHDMAQTLAAAMINDPLFGGSGVPLDPGVLFTPPAGKRARVSVISLIGLPSNEQRQSFANQLQMALFAWIKQHPAGNRPLGGLFVMDEAQTLAPSGAMTACTESTLALASQARKYGLGLVFATQAPRGIHNRIVGNAATQFYGFLNSQAQITAAKEMAQAKASGVLDISRLTAGQFYAAGEGLGFQKVATPMCLSQHPKSALTSEEVLRRARA